MGNVLNFSVTREIVALTDVKFDVQCQTTELVKYNKLASNV